MANLILASGSPRRKDLLVQLGIPFTIHTAGITENYPADMPIEEVPQYLARQKAMAVQTARQSTDEWILAADTIVRLNGRILEKPADEEEARRMLGLLSGQTHTVITGVCLLKGDDCDVFTAMTKVHFGVLTQEEIAQYVSTAKPLDKAGSYAIQEWIGMIGIKGIEGDYFNVVGLPVSMVYARLKEKGIV